MVHFQFLYADGHANLPLLTGIGALLALGAIFTSYATKPPKMAAARAWTIAILWVLIACGAIASALLLERSFAPIAQLEARYHPIFVSAALGTVLVLLLEFSVPDQSLIRPAIACVVIATYLAQVAADVTETRRWHDYIVDLRSRLATGRGVIPWEQTLSTHDRLTDVNWRLMAVPWVIPITSIAFSPKGVVRSIIDLPIDMTLAETDRPVDPRKPDQLPILPGIDYRPYREFVAEQRPVTPR